jgi:hypothetical protein
LRTAKEIVEQVYIRVSGGALSADVNVVRADIFAMLPAAIGHIALISHREDRREQLQDIQVYGGGALSEVNAPILSTIQLPVEEDTDRDLHYMTVPGTIVGLPGDRGMNSVFPSQGDASYIRLRDPREAHGLSCDGVVFFWQENVAGDTRIYLKGLGSPVCDHYAKLVYLPSDLSESDMVPLSGTVELRVIEYLVDFFTKQRMTPDDSRHDDNEDEQ